MLFRLPGIVSIASFLERSAHPEKGSSLPGDLPLTHYAGACRLLGSIVQRASRTLKRIFRLDRQAVSQRKPAREVPHVGEDYTEFARVPQADSILEIRGPLPARPVLTFGSYLDHSPMRGGIIQSSSRFHKRAYALWVLDCAGGAVAPATPHGALLQPRRAEPHPWRRASEARSAMDSRSPVGRRRAPPRPSASRAPLRRIFALRASSLAPQPVAP